MAKSLFEEAYVHVSAIQQLGRDLVDPCTNIKELAQRYVQWYEKVERLIKVFLKTIGIDIQTVRDPVTGAHRHHEEILESLRDPENPYHDVLGCGTIHECLCLAKRLRNVVRGKGSGIPRVRSPKWGRWTEAINMIESGLWTATGIMISERKHKRVDKTMDVQKGLVSEKQQLQQDRLYLREKKTQEEAIKKDNGDPLEQNADYIALTEHEMEGLEESGSEETAFPIVAGTEREATGLIEAHEDQEQETYPYHEHGHADTPYMSKTELAARGAKIRAGRSQLGAMGRTLGKALKLNKELVTSLNQLEKEKSNLEDQSLKMSAENQAISDHQSNLCAMIVNHQRSRNYRIPTTLMEDDEAANSTNLTALIRSLMASHVFAEKQAKAAMDETGSRQKELDGLQRRLAAAEASHLSDQEMVVALISDMDHCCNSNHQLLKKVYDRT